MEIHDRKEMRQENVSRIKEDEVAPGKQRGEPEARQVLQYYIIIYYGIQECTILYPMLYTMLCYAILYLKVVDAIGFLERCRGRAGAPKLGGSAYMYVCVYTYIYIYIYIHIYITMMIIITIITCTYSYNVYIYIYI